jgi:hypothetical protein
VGHPVLAERGPREPGLPDGGAAVEGVPRPLVLEHALPEGERNRRLGLLGVDHRTLDLGEDVGGEVPPLHEEDAASRRFEVVVHGDGERGDVAAVAVDGDDVLEPVVDERVADLAEHVQEGRRREAHAPGELHVVPGDGHVQGGGDEELDALLGAQLGGPRAERARDETVRIEGHVVPVLLGRADRDQDGVDAALACGLDLPPGEALEKALVRHASSSQGTLA